MQSLSASAWFEIGTDSYSNIPRSISTTSYICAALIGTSPLQVDNASALIAAAKNLMTAVVLAVKTCYVASSVVSYNGNTLLY